MHDQQELPKDSYYYAPICCSLQEGKVSFWDNRVPGDKIDDDDYDDDYHYHESTDYKMWQGSLPHKKAGKNSLSHSKTAFNAPNPILLLFLFRAFLIVWFWHPHNFLSLYITLYFPLLKINYFQNIAKFQKKVSNLFIKTSSANSRCSYHNLRKSYFFLVRSKKQTRW